MTDKQKLVVIVTNGFNDERSSVAWSVANGAIGSDMDVTMFLVSSGVDWVRKGAANQARLNPLDPPVRDMIQTVVDNGGKILVRPPCAGLCGYEGGRPDGRRDAGGLCRDAGKGQAGCGYNHLLRPPYARTRAG